ncbi:MAG: tetratricopeptide repeat protein [Proteobacteria bacterium]|nr:tetratricopeptide repeat protein [Pseudomonadota bacterium]
MTNIPKSLKESLEKGQAIPFVGAGVSMSVTRKSDGKPLFPSWKALLTQAAEYLEQDGKDDDAGIVRGFVNKNRFLDAAKEARQALGSNWFGFLKRQLDPRMEDTADVSLELARRVWQIGSKLIITTNYDKVLRWACPQKDDLAEWDIEAPAEQCGLLREGLSKPAVWHLHGKIDNAAEIILTPDGYQKLYPEDKGESLYKAALETLRNQLASRTFIFIGFSLADEDFVSQLKSVEEVFQGATGPHYVLLPESQRNLFQAPSPSVEPLYFRGFGAPLLELLDELASLAKPGTASITPAISTSGEVADFSLGKSVFHVPYRSKGELMIGRQEALEQVRRQLCTGTPTSIGQTASFQGLGGLGKTQLAVEYAYAYREEYPNGVIWINADQDIIAQLIPLTEQAGWVSPLSDPAFKVTQAIKRLREYSDCLIIFDNLESQEAIAEFLPSPQASPHILVTSRLEQHGFTPIPLDTLTPELGLELLVQVAERQPQTEDEQQAAQAIVERLDGLPLALELAGAFLRRRNSVGWRQYLQLLQDDLTAAFPASLQKESLTRHEADIYSTLKIHETLFKEEPLLREVLDVLTWSGPATMSLSLLCALLAQDKASSLTGALSLGCELRILQKPGVAERYAIHRLVREVRRAELPLPQRRDWAETCGQRLADWFQAHRQEFSDLPLYEAELDHLFAWRQHAETLSFPLLAARLAWLQSYPAWHWGRYRESQQTIQQAQSLYAQSPTQDDELEAHLLADLGVVTALLGDAKTSLKLEEKALHLRLALFDQEHIDTARSLSNLAGYYSDLGNTQRALELGEQALEIQRKLFGKENPETAGSLDNLSGYYNYLRKHQHALKLGEQALAIHRKLFGEEHPSTATSLGKISNSYANLRDFKRALELGEQARAIQCKLLGDTHPSTVITSRNLIRTLFYSGKRPEALQRLKQQLAVLEKDHPQYGKLITLQEELLRAPPRKGFRQQPKTTGGKSKKRH